MRVLTIVHQQDAGPGVFLDPLGASGAEIDTWFPSDAVEPPAEAETYGAILSFGGDAHPAQHDHYPWLVAEKRFLASALKARRPMLGVCLGAELIAEAEGTATRRATRPEIGWYDVKLTAAGVSDPVLGPTGPRFQALEWHSYEIVLPSRATALARSDSCLQAFRIGGHAWGIQFHAEVTGDDFQHWLDTYMTDEDAVENRIDVDAIAAINESRMQAWNELGRGICERFLQAAAAQ
jgi:GMP synthase (glutamine-hydrolysing)